MSEIRYVQPSDKEFWFTLDRHMSEQEFDKKVRDRQGYVISEDGKPVGILRYSLFWDNTPFCNLIYVRAEDRKKGYGRKLMERWESDIKSQGYEFVLTSTQSNETAQHFYRKLGYTDCGGLLLHDEPMEIILIKKL